MILPRASIFTEFFELPLIGQVQILPDQIRHFSKQHLREQNPTSYQYREDFIRLLGNDLIQSIDRNPVDQGTVALLATAVQRLAMPSLERQCLIRYDEHSPEGQYLHETTEVITWSGAVMVFRRLRTRWTLWTLFFTHRSESDRPNFRATLQARCRYYGEEVVVKGRRCWLYPRPEFQVKTRGNNNLGGYRTNIRFVSPVNCGWRRIAGQERRILDVYSIPRWVDPGAK